MELFPYQKEGVEFLRKRKRSLLADSPGLGKTSQAICTTNYWNIKQIVVICPAVLIYNWEEEFKQWGPNKKVFVFNGKKSLAKYKDQEVIVVSYHSAKHITQLLKHNEFALICDESHYIKNPLAKITYLIMSEFIRFAERVILMTGTPITNTIPDLWTSIFVCSPKNANKFEEFCNKYSFKTWNGFSYIYRGVRNEKELTAILDTFMLRRKKEEVLPQLPEKVYNKLYTILDADIIAESMEYENLATSLINGKGISKNDMSDFAKIRKELAIAKADTNIKAILNLLNEGSRPIVAFGHHREAINRVFTGLKKAKVKVATITGSDSALTRQSIVTNFQSGKLDVVILSIKAASVGITLTKSNVVFFCEPSVVPAEMMQAVDRCHRIGQDRGVHIISSIAKGSLDVAVYNLLRQKIRHIEKVI